MPRQNTARPSPEEEEAVLPQKDLFKDPETGFRIAFFIHKSIKKRSRRFLTEDIESRGGIVVDDDEGANTVLVSKDFPKAELQTAYNAHSSARLRKIVVEPSTFIGRCINDNSFHHRKPEIKGMPGRPPGRRRIEFSEEDDQNLCRYLSRILPNKESGGRLGLNVYRSLITIARHKPDEYQWALRHTPESWKQRYKRFAHRFDQLISEMVEADPGNEYPWPEDRRMTHKRLRRVGESDSDSEDSEEGQTSESESEEEYVLAASPKHRRSRRSSLPNPPPPKRARIVSQTHRPSRRRRPSTKGKERALEEELDAEHPREGTGDLDEDGDFQPPRTPADDVHYMHPSPEQLTQDTLVGTLSRDDPSKVASASTNRARNSDPFSQPTNERIARASLHPRQHPKSMVYVDLRAPPRHRMPPASQPQAQSSPRRAGLEPPQPTPPMPPPAQPSKAYERPKKAARPPPELVQQAVQDSSGLYRNTRSRSVSVYPPSVMPSAAKTHRRKKGKAKQTDVLPEEEVIEEDMLLVEENIAPMGETLAEERDVENLLNAGIHEQSITTSASRAQSIMESDDAQIARHLREGSIASSRIAPAKGFSSLLIHPDDFLKQVGTSTTSHSRRSILLPFGRNSSVLPPSEALHNRPRQSEPLGLRRESPGIFKAPDPYTPQQRVRKRPGSTSSSESFPLSGTRASAFKKTLRQLEKRSPYKPPAGTRAAELVMNNSR